jgi:hypothetical protein
MQTIVKQLTTFGCIILLGLAGCSPAQLPSLAGSWVYKEVMRITSPDGRVDAVVVSGDGGATTSLVYSVYLVPVGGKVERGERDGSNFDADHFKGFGVSWKESRILEIKYDEARILDFRNYWYSREVDDFNYVVEVVLAPTRAESSLPARDHFPLTR